MFVGNNTTAASEALINSAISKGTVFLKVPGSGRSQTQSIFIREDTFLGPASESLRWRRGRAHSCPGTENDVRGRVGS